MRPGFASQLPFLSLWDSTCPIHPWSRIATTYKRRLTCCERRNVDAIDVSRRLEGEKEKEKRKSVDALIPAELQKGLSKASRMAAGARRKPLPSEISH